MTITLREEHFNLLLKSGLAILDIHKAMTAMEDDKETTLFT